MAPTNDTRIAQALEILQKCLRTLVEERMRSEYNDLWLQKACLSLTNFRASYAGRVNLDVQALIRIATDKQHTVLHNSFSRRELNFLYELWDIRNRHAHQNPFDKRDVERALDTMELFLQSIQSPEAARIALLRSSLTPTAQKAATLIPSVPEAPVAQCWQLSVGPNGLQRGVRLFRYLAERANCGRAIGISYSHFLAFLHAKGSFREVAGRNYLPSDSGAIIELAWSVTAANGGRIPVTGAGRTVQSGMDSFIWASSAPYDRSEKAWHNPKCTLPYSRTDWKTVFPDGVRRMISPDELGKVA